MRKQANGAIERCVRRLTVDILAVVKRAVREQVLEALRAARTETEAPHSARSVGKSRRGIQKRKKAGGAKAQAGKKGIAQAVARARGAARGLAGKRARNSGSASDGIEVADITLRGEGALLNDGALGDGVVLKWPRKRRGRRSNGASRSSSRNGSSKPNGPMSPLLDGALGEAETRAEHAPAPTPLFVHRRKRDGTIQPIERNDAGEPAQTESLE